MPRRAHQRALRASVVITTLMLAAGLSACGKTATSASLVAEAKQYQAKGDKKAALIQYKNAATKSPEDAEVRFELASLYNQMGDPVSAEKEIRKAISLGFDGARAAPQLASALLAQNQPQKAIDESAAYLAKADPALLATRGDAYLGLDQVDKAKESYRQALAAKPGHAEALTGMARVAMREKDIEAADRFAEQATSANPKDPQVWFFKGTLRQAQGKPAEALEAFSQTIALRPDHVSALLERASIEIAGSKFDAAKADIDAAKKTAPNSLQAIYTQAVLDFSQNNFAAANESLQKVMRLAPDHMPSNLLAGAVELNLGSLLQAEQHLNKYLGKYPNNTYARKLLAQAMLKSSQPAGAVAALAPALADGKSQDPQLLALAGESAMRNRDFGNASQYFEKAAGLAPNAAALHTSLGIAKLGEGDMAKGISELERATALDPKSTQAGIALVRAHLGMKQYDKAVLAMKALVAAHPEDAIVRNLEGGVYMSKADFVSARASFEKSSALQPTYLEPVLNLAQLDLQDKKPDAAKQRLVAFLEKDKKSVAAMSALAALALNQNKTGEATTWFEKANAENPDAVAPAVQLANHYLRTEQKQKALLLTRKLQTANPSNVDVLDLLGQAQVANDDKAGALDTYGKLAGAAPKSAAAQFRLASVHMLMKNQAAAADDLKKALVLQPGFMPALLGQSELALRQNKPDEALAIARQIQKMPAARSTGLLLEADILNQQKQPAQALAVYEKAFALGKTSKLLIIIHRLQSQQGKEKEADARLAQWNREHPADVLSAMYVAETYINRKQYKLAIPQLVGVLKQTPNNAVALNNLAWCYQQEKDPKALETAEQAYKLAGEAPAVLDTLGAILTEQGDTRRSLPLLQKAVGLAPASLDFRLHLAQALAKSGDKVNARKELQQIVAKGNETPHFAEAELLLKQL